jgi:hypothetical protein
MMNMLEARIPGAEKAFIKNMLESKNTWRRGSFAKLICWKARIPGAMAALQNEYAGKQEYLVQRKIFTMNMNTVQRTYAC